MIRNEMPHETYLELAATYLNLGLEGDARKALAVAPEQAEIRYWQAYLLRNESPEESLQVLRQASALSPYLVFPFRQEAIPIFEWASQALPGNWKAGYYLGLIEWGIERNADALKRFTALGERPDYAVFYASRAHLEQASDPAKAEADFEKARSVDPADWRNHNRLIAFQLARGMDAKALASATAASARFPQQDQIKIALARADLRNGRYQACYETLNNANVLPFEGQRDIQALYANCQMALAIEAIGKGDFKLAEERLNGSKVYPEHLGTGKPADPDFRVQDYLLMLSHERAAGPADAAGAAARKAEFDAYAARHSRKTWAELRAQLDAWANASLGQKDPMTALEELSAIVRGPRGL